MLFGLAGGEQARCTLHYWPVVLGRSVNFWHVQDGMGIFLLALLVFMSGFVAVTKNAS